MLIWAIYDPSSRNRKGHNHVCSIRCEIIPRELHTSFTHMLTSRFSLVDLGAQQLCPRCLQGMHIHKEGPPSSKLYLGHGGGAS